jgi:ATP-dependent DNA helicase RecQ
VEQSQPPFATLKVIYQNLANFYQLALGSGEGESFDFDIHTFCEQFQMNAIEVYNGLKKLEEEGLLQFNESFYSPSTIHISVDHTKLYELQVANAGFDELIKMLLRLYGGELFSSFVKVDEVYLGKALKISSMQIVERLKHLNELNILVYLQAKDQPQVTYILPRQDAEHLPIDKKRLDARRKLIFDKMKAMISFTESTFRCRMQLIQDYFNEDTDSTCGICDVCIEKRKKDNAMAFEKLREQVITVMKKNVLTVEQLEHQVSPKDRELFVDVVRELVDEGMLNYDKVWKLRWGGAEIGK